MPNMKAVISSHNKIMLAQDSATTAPSQQPRTRNWRNKPESAHYKEKCMHEYVVYQATVATETTTENYVGLASNFKKRYRNHQTSFRHPPPPNKRSDTESKLEGSLAFILWTLWLVSSSLTFWAFLPPKPNLISRPGYVQHHCSQFVCIQTNCVHIADSQRNKNHETG